LALGSTLVVTVLADEPGLASLDQATETKLSARRLRDLDRVIELCEEAIEKGLNDANKQYAVDLLTSTLYERAERLIEPVLEGQLDATWSRRRDLARASLEQALEKKSTDGEIHLLLAQVLALPGGDASRGREAAEKAVELLRDNPPRRSVALLASAHFVEDADQKLERINAAIESDPRNLDAWRERGRLRLAKNDDAGAVEDFLHLLEENAEDAEALRSVAQALAGQEKYEEALEHINKAIAVNPEAASVFALRASIHMMQGKADEALADLNTALKIEPRDVGSLMTRAAVRVTREEFDEALADAGRALELRPGLPQALLLRSEIAVAAGKYPQAISDLRQLLRRDPDNLRLKTQMAAVYLADQRPRKAIELYSSVIDADDQQWRALRGRGDARLGIGDHAGAVADYQRALELAPEDSGLLNNLAWVLATSPDDNLRNGQRAVELATKACELTEYDAAHILSTLAAGFAELGQFDTAIKWSQKAVEKGKGEEEIREQLAAELDSYQHHKPWRERQTVEETENEEPDVSDLRLETPPATSNGDPAHEGNASGGSSLSDPTGEADPNQATSPTGEASDPPIPIPEDP
jgi:tetratricopeptide (TPR) repeat protein